MAKLVNRAKMTTATTGTGTITLGSAVDGFQTFAAAGVTDGDVVSYVIEDGTDWEVGTGTYTASGTTLSRTVSESSNADAAISLSGSATVFVMARAEDIVALDANTNATFPNELKATQYAGTAASALSGTTPTLDMSVATQFTLTTSGNTTITIDPDNFDLNDAFDGGCKLYVTQGATAYTVGFSGSPGVTVEFAGGTAPDAPAASTKDLYYITKQSATVVQVFKIGVDVS